MVSLRVINRVVSIVPWLQAAACKNILVMEYETALRKAALDLKKAEETIKIKEAELETIKKRSSME